MLRLRSSFLAWFRHCNDIVGHLQVLRDRTSRLLIYAAACDESGGMELNARTTSTMTSRSHAIFTLVAIIVTASLTSIGPTWTMAEGRTILDVTSRYREVISIARLAQDGM
jgi:hypothetical protein